MTRVEHIADGITLHLGDCREIIPAVTADALITDPVWPNCPPDLLIGGNDPMALWVSFWKAMPAVTRAAIVMRHDSDPRFLAPVPMSYLRAVILPYVMPGYIGRFLGGDELAYCFGEPIPSRKGQRVIPGRAPAAQPDKRSANGHPCSRCLDHFSFLVRWWSEPGEIVLDPFMGSGTTGAACVKLGRRFVGVEVEPKFFDIACRRIEEATKQQDLFIERLPAPLQAELLA
jgi:hypothetical protein